MPDLVRFFGFWHTRGLKRRSFAGVGTQRLFSYLIVDVSVRSREQNLCEVSVRCRGLLAHSIFEIAGSSHLVSSSQPRTNRQNTRVLMTPQIFQFT